MRRHSFRNISESTLAYISDCPVKFSVNVMKDYNEEVLNASFNEEYEESEQSGDLELSGFTDTRSVHSKKSSITASVNLPKGEEPRANFAKKKPTPIFENTDLVSKWENDAKVIEDRQIKIQQEKLKK